MLLAWFVQYPTAWFRANSMCGCAPECPRIDGLNDMFHRCSGKRASFFAEPRTAPRVSSSIRHRLLCSDCELEYDLVSSLLVPRHAAWSSIFASFSPGKSLCMGSPCLCGLLTTNFVNWTEHPIFSDLYDWSFPLYINVP
jgi:hypothetical protein